MVKGLGNNALTSAIGPAKERFRGALRAAVDGHNHARIAELEVFRKDVGTYVRLYDFLSQIVDFGDTDVEKHAIFFRVLATQIRSTRTAPDIDLSDVSLIHIKQKQKEHGSLDLVHTEPLALGPSFGGAGSRSPRDPRM